MVFSFSLLSAAVFYFIIKYYGNRGVETNVRVSNEKYNIINWFQLNARERKLEDSNFIDNTDGVLNNYFEERKKYYGVLESQYKGIIIFKIVFTAIVLFLELI